jgi:hypothetical protein
MTRVAQAQADVLAYVKISHYARYLQLAVARGDPHSVVCRAKTQETHTPGEPSALKSPFLRYRMPENGPCFQPDLRPSERKNTSITLLKQRLGSRAGAVVYEPALALSF